MAHKYLRLIGAISIVLGAANITWPILPMWVAYLFLLVGFVLVLIELPGIAKDVLRTINRLPIRGPLLWDYKGFLGANWRSGEAVHVTVFQANGENISHHPVEILDAIIQSNITGEQIIVTFKTNGGYTTADNLNPIPPGARFNAHALFYDPGSKEPNERDGLPEDEFLENWSEFRFIFKTQKGDFKRLFSNKEIIKQIARVKPSSKATRRISRKSAPVNQRDQITFIKFNPKTFETISDSGNVTSITDIGTGEFGITFALSLDANELICTAIGETPRDFEIVTFTPDYIHLKFKNDPEIVHLRFGR